MRTAIPIAAFAVALAAPATAGALAQDGQGVQATSASEPAGRTLSPEERAAAVQSSRKHGTPATKTKPPPRRRSVQQIIATVPPPQLAGPSYGPTLYPPPPAPAPVAAPALAPGAAPVYPPPAAALGTCQGSACTDTAGGTYYLSLIHI